jgi:putative ABC transport system permease protein
VARKETIEAVLGRRLREDESRRLEAGAALVLNRKLVGGDGRIEIAPPLGAPRVGILPVRIPALVVEYDRQYVTAPLAYVTERALRGSALVASSRRLVLFDGPKPSRDREDLARASLGAASGAEADFIVERGAAGRSVAGRLLVLVAVVLVLTVTLITVTSVVLSAAEMTPDLAVLAAVGSTRRLRKTLSAAQAAALAGGGALIGSVLGALAAVAVAVAADVPVELAPFAGLVLAAGVVLAAAGAATWAATPATMPLPTSME